MIKKFILLIILAAAFIAFITYFNGGKYVKKAGVETYKVGDDLEKLGGEMRDKEKTVRKKVKELKEEFVPEDKGSVNK